MSGKNWAQDIREEAYRAKAEENWVCCPYTVGSEAAVIWSEAYENGRPAPFYSVAVYMVDRQYGGPEEGGWYYDAGVLINYTEDGMEDVLAALGEDRTFTFPTRQAAAAFRDKLESLLSETLNKGRRPLHSVLSNGMYRAEVHENFPPPYWPSERPYYS